MAVVQISAHAANAVVSGVVAPRRVARQAGAFKSVPTGIASNTAARCIAHFSDAVINLAIRNCIRNRGRKVKMIKADGARVKATLIVKFKVRFGNRRFPRFRPRTAKVESAIKALCVRAQRR